MGNVWMSQCNAGSGRVNRVREGCDPQVLVGTCDLRSEARLSNCSNDFTYMSTTKPNEKQPF